MLILQQNSCKRSKPREILLWLVEKGPESMKKKIKSTGIIFSDMHFPLHDEKAFSCALKVIEKVKPDVFINLGDFAEGEYVSSIAFN